ncbi:heat shock protein [Colletotrichum orchidophilum]|uniref:Heat shock protein n=1 Tax=Colletotrichum orchidophilum TaxID=1209926 RepID=A0A1G4BGU9_9PEZI|nr:heat shock protein [Colletotrichum orchidophilum]OHF00586.1 heat shock protein [Colletotrichum orchidophilum]
MSFILADEATVEASFSSHSPPAPRPREQRKQATSAALGDGSAQRRPCSAISSSSSRPNSLAGSLSEYQESFVMSAFGTSDAGRPQSIYNGEGAQQFIMPTINVPSRRPFTEAGKGLGRLKLLVAGRSVAMASKGFLPAKIMPNSPPISQGTFQITETLASTKPYPPWWKELARTSPALAPGQSEDTILDRNICLVDTPGYQETCRLEALTNVIPLIAQADTLTPEQIAAIKKHIAQQFAEAGLGLFSFDPSTTSVGEQHIYATSSKLASDTEVMDASLLMSSEYLQPLVPTDLSHLLESIFCVNGATWLRHAAAAKLLGWRTRHPGSSNVSGFVSKSEGSTDMWLLRPRAGSLTPLAMSRAPNYANCEERLCRVQLTNWAADLQRSLANEKRIQESRAWEQAATWSREAWRDESAASGGDGADMALMRTRGRGERRQSFRKRRHSTGSGLNWGLARHQDPLGLLQLNADFRWQGWKTLEMVGGIGILGGLAWLLV